MTGSFNLPAQSGKAPSADSGGVQQGALARLACLALCRAVPALAAIAGTAVVLVASLFSSYVLCCLIIGPLGAVLGRELPLPLSGNWVANGFWAFVGLGMLALVTVRAYNSKAFLDTYTMLSWDRKYKPSPSALGTALHIGEESVIRLLAISWQTLVALWGVVVLHVVPVLALLACILVLLLAIVLSWVICSAAIWLLNMIPGVAIPYPGEGGWILNLIVIAIGVAMIPVSYIIFATAGSAMERHPFLGGLFVGLVIGQNSHSSEHNNN